jgi:shikimate kinase
VSAAIGRGQTPEAGVVLVGFMGSGKTSVGRALARRLDVSFADSDATIEERHGSIAALFARDGEAGFRTIEREAVLALLTGLRSEPGVLALGGGAVKDADVRAALQGTLVVWLAAPPDVLWRRVSLEQADTEAGHEARADDQAGHEARADDQAGHEAPSAVDDAQLRPLAADEATFRRLFAERETLYRGVADLTIDADRPLEVVVCDLLVSLGREP